MSVEVVTEARSMADFILRSAFRGPGDTIDAAMHRAEREYGAPSKWLHRLRYRSSQLRDLPASAFFQLQKALLSLLFGATWAFIGWRWNARREAIRTESRWWLAPVVEHDISELPAVIRARAEELILP